MDKYNIIRNREPLTEQEIRAQKNFEGLLERRNLPLSRGRGVWGEVGAVTAGTAVLLGVIFTMLPGKEEKEQSPPRSLTENSIKPNLQGVDIPYLTFSAGGDRADVFSVAGGSRILVPEGAFLDEKGNPVKGKVDLRYREFHNPEDFFISGIPMTYDSAGMQYHFESGGMFEILAFQGDKPLFANPEKPVRVELASRNPGDHFNQYYLDPKSGKWKFLGKDTAGSSSDWQKELDSLLEVMTPEKAAEWITNKLRDALNEKVKIDLKKPPFPQKAVKGKTNFVIDVDSTQFPEIAKFKNVKFEVSDRNRDFRPEKAAKTWRGAKLTRVDSTNDYLITFTDWREKYTVIAVPVLEGEDYEKAKLEFDKKYSSYNAESGLKQQEIIRRQNQLRQLSNTYGIQVDSENRDQSATLLYNSEKVITTHLVFRVFTVDEFGTYNCDCPKALPKGRDVVAVFCDSSGRKLDLDYIYLVEKDKKQMYTYYQRALNSFKYNPNRKNMVWSVTKTNELVTLSPEEFRKVKPKRDTCVYTVKINKARITSEELARKCLDM